MADFEERIELLQQYVNEAKHIAFFGGAGVSTESGIPDFRSKDGLYNQKDVHFEQYSPEYLLSHSCLYDHPKVFYEFYRQKMDCRNIEPNITHKVLAQWEEKGKRVSVITQNIDGLHQKAGSKEVYEVHGSTQRNYCNCCGKKYPSDYIFESNEDVPRCPDCGAGSMIRPEVTLYEENLPQAFSDATMVLHKADLMIIAGTSLTVYPAANMVRDFYGKHLVVVNRDVTSQDKNADLVFHENMGQVFGRIQVRIE